MRSLLVLAVGLAACKEQGHPDAGPRPVDARPQERAWAFDQTAPGLSVAAGEWKVRPAPDAPSPPDVLVQEASSEEDVFNVALLDGTSYGDLDLSVKLKAIDGEVDQGGGLVWRAKDARNYYIARYNPLEVNFRVYKVIEGVRTQLGHARAADAPGWHTLRVRMKGDAIECELDGKVRLEAKDATLPGPGRIGFWTKADARTQFDDLSVR